MRPLYDAPVPEGWTELPLRSVARRRRGYSWSKDQESPTPAADTLPVIRIPNVQNELDLTDLLHLRGVTPEEVSAFAVEKDWILFVASNGNPDRIGDSVLIDEDRRMLIASFLQAISSSDAGQLLPEFLAEWLRLHNVHQTFSKTSQQTTGLANLSWDAVKNLPVRFPVDVEAQREIVNPLGYVTRACAAAELELVATQRVKTALLRELFSRGLPGLHRDLSKSKWLTCPSDWNRKPLRRIAQIDSGFTMGRDLKGSVTVSVPYVTVVNVQEGRLDLGSVSRTELKEPELATALLQPGDVLMTEGGDRDKLGRGCLWSGEFPECTYQNHIFRVRLDNSEYRAKLFHYLIQTEAAKRYFSSHAKQTSNLCTINSRELGQFEVGVPETSEQDAMLRELEGVDALLAAIQRERDALQRLERSLRENAVGGRADLRRSVPA